jgi:hypothetical protein
MFVTGLIRKRTTAEEAEDEGSSEEDEEDLKKVETYSTFRFSEVKRNLDSIISFLESDPQYNK